MTAIAPPAIDLDGLLRRLHLPTVRRLYPDLAQRAESVFGRRSCIYCVFGLIAAR